MGVCRLGVSSFSYLHLLHEAACGRAGAITYPSGIREGSLWDGRRGSPSRCRAAHLILVGLAPSPSGVVPSIRAPRQCQGSPGPFSPSASASRLHPILGWFFWPRAPARLCGEGARAAAIWFKSSIPPAAFTLRALCAWGRFRGLQWGPPQARWLPHFGSLDLALGRPCTGALCAPLLWVAYARLSGLGSSRLARPTALGSLGLRRAMPVAGGAGH